MPAGTEFERNRLRLITALLIVVAASVVGVLAWREFHVRQGFYSLVIESRARTTTREFDNFFNPVGKRLNVIRSWGSEGNLPLDDPPALDTLLLPVLNTDTWLDRLILTDGEGQLVGFERGTSGFSRVGDQASDAEAFERSDPKSEPWFAVAANDPDNATVHWSRELSDDPDAMLFASISWTDPGPEGALRVLAAGLAPAVLDTVVANFPLTAGGMVAVLAPGEAAAWHMPAYSSGFSTTELARLIHPSTPQEQLLSDALYGFNHADAELDHAFRFRHEGARWWGCRTRSMAGAGDRELLLLLPRVELEEGLLTVTSPLSYALLVLLGVSVFLLFRLTLGFRGRLERVTQAASHVDLGEDELRDLIRTGESDLLEFKSTLRWNMREKRPGKEIELSWLKTVVAFLNTSGGTLLVGVADNGKIVGCERDGFANEDKYMLHVNNLVQRHVGVEFARYLRYDLRPVGERKILVLDVMPGDEPAFLSNNEDDLFYIRMGPASRKLGLKKTLEYIREFESR